MIELEPITGSTESIFGKDFEEAIKRFLGYSDEFPEKFYKFRKINKNTIDLIIKKKVYFSNIFSLNDPLECPFLQNNPDIRKEAFTIHNLEPKIFSLVAKDEYDNNQISSAINNTLMFSHYADAHKGICIEYKLNFEKNFEEKKMFLTKVQYQDKLGFVDVKSLFATKDKRWSYENEYRFIAFGGPSFYDLEGEITKIIFGLKTSPEDIDLMKKILENQNTEFYQTKQKGDAYFDFIFEKL